MTARTAIVTGVLGQDGTLLAALLQQRGWHVIGLARPGTLAAAAADPARAALLSRCELLEVDVGDEVALDALIAATRPDAIYHLAAAHHSSEGAAHETAALLAQMTRVNFNSTEALARIVATRAPQVRLVYAASSQIWTASQPGERVDEATPRRPATWYGHTKSWAMDCLAFWRGRHGQHASCAILFNHESHLRAPAFVTRKITSGAARIAAGERTRLRLFNIGARVDWSAAQDVVEALAAMADAPEPDDYVVASGAAHSVRALLDIAFGHVGIDWRDWVDHGGDSVAPHLIGSPARAAERLGWQPRVPFEAMIRAMVDHDLAALRRNAGAVAAPA